MVMTLKERLILAAAGPPKVTKVAIANACGIKPPSVSDWFSGRTKTIEGPNLVRAAKFLRVNAEWLATGKGKMRPESEPLTDEVLGESMTSAHVATPSHSMTLDPHILVEAEKWVLFEEGPNREHAYGLFPRAERLSALYAMIAADGGTMSPSNAKRLIEAARARSDREDGDERRIEDRAGRNANG